MVSVKVDLFVSRMTDDTNRLLLPSFKIKTLPSLYRYKNNSMGDWACLFQVQISEYDLVCNPDCNNLKRVNFSYVEKLGSLGYDRTIVVILRPYTYQTITGEFRVGVGL